MGQEDNKISLYFSLSFRGSILLKSSREESELFSLYSSGTRNTKHKIILKVYKTVQGQEIFLSKFEGGGIMLICGECTIIYLYLNILFQIVIKTFNIHFLALSKRDMDSRFFFLAQSQCWIQLSFINFPR